MQNQNFVFRPSDDSPVTEKNRNIYSAEAVYKNVKESWDTLQYDKASGLERLEAIYTLSSLPNGNSLQATAKNCFICTE
ncbi:MAG: hypothetical protein O2840_04485 [bacterium]|nr:hypothetical protein [bacterium]